MPKKKALDEAKAAQDAVVAEMKRINVVLDDYKEKHAHLQEEATKTRAELTQLQQVRDGLASEREELKRQLEAERKAHEETKSELGVALVPSSDAEEVQRLKQVLEGLKEKFREAHKQAQEEVRALRKVNAS